MSRVHPAEGKVDDHVDSRERRPTALTVWKKSSMAFQGTDGFSVYDGEGKLAFRVDNYSRRVKSFGGGEVVLMDGDGKGLLSLRPQFFSMHEQWNGYKCEESSNKRSKWQVFSMRRSSLFQSSDQAEVFMGSSSNDSSKSKKLSFQIEGCFRSRCCKILSSKGEEVAKICRKNAGPAAVMLGEDVFSLVVEPGVDCELVMAFVVVMDRICRRPSTPLMCS